MKNSMVALVPQFGTSPYQNYREIPHWDGPDYRDVFIRPGKILQVWGGVISF
jgi:hypothetical protein